MTSLFLEYEMLKKLLVVPFVVAMAFVFVPDSASAADGKAEWKSGKCAKCHGDDGKGQTKIGKKKNISDMTTADWQKKVSDDAIRDAIKVGVDRVVDGKKQKMKPLKNATDDQVEALLKFIRSLAS